MKNIQEARQETRQEQYTETKEDLDSPAAEAKKQEKWQVKDPQVNETITRNAKINRNDTCYYQTCNEWQKRNHVNIKSRKHDCFCEWVLVNE